MSDLNLKLLISQLSDKTTSRHKAYANLFKYLFDKNGVPDVDLIERIKSGELV